MILAVIAVCAFAADPWVMNPAYANAPASLRPSLPEVHEVYTDEWFVHVTSAGLSLHSFGALEANQYAAPTGLRALNFDLPRFPKPAGARHAATPLGIVGVFVTGVPIYNATGAVSWQDQNLWHRDAVAMSNMPSPLLDSLNRFTGRHSPIVGFALDGYPIYGPFGSDESGVIRRMRSGYRLRQMGARSVWPDGTALSPGQEGPAVDAAHPLGMFAEDYAYVPGSGDLDEFNGRWARTPEFPEGAYAYFLATDEAGRPAWPYLLGPRYFGEVPGIGSYPKGVSREDDRLILNLGLRFIEKTHEQPIHLAIVSSDLSDFSHVHPEPIPGDAFAVTHTFARAGRYWLYAEYTPPGAAPRIDRFELQVERGSNARVPQTAADVNVTFKTEGPLLAGADIAMSFTLVDAMTGKPVDDLQPWLGAWAHVMAVSRDGSEFIHAHPEGDAPGPLHAHSFAGPSPSVIGTVTGFRKPGAYKLWFQFRRNGAVQSVPFTLSIAPPRAPAKKMPPPAAAIRVNVTAAGFEPARIRIAAGAPVQLAFTRNDARSCAREVVFPELGIRAALPPMATVLVNIPAGNRDLHFACGMGMLRGALVLR